MLKSAPEAAHGCQGHCHQEPCDASDGVKAIEPLLPLPYPPEPRNQRTPTLGIVIPAHNEEEVLPATAAELTAVLEAMDVRWKVVFVNDGSKDGTGMVLETLFQQDPRLEYITLSRNFGHQAALTAGLDGIDTEIVVMMDADLQHPPSVLPQMLAAWQQGYDVVHTRKIQTEGLSLFRTVSTRLAYYLMRRVSAVRIIPHASDYRLLDRAVVETLRSMPESNPLYRGLTSWMGFCQCVLPFVAPRRAAGESSYSLRQLVGLLSRGLLDYTHQPLQCGLVAGAVAMLLSAAFTVFMMGWMVFGAEAPPGWATNMLVTMVLNSVTLTFCGIVGLYVARIYDEVRRRPTFIIHRHRRPNEATGRQVGHR